jgi:hypothetical protein
MAAASGIVRAPLAAGVLAGLIAGVPQVLLTQIEARLLPATRTEQADIGPRFIERLAERVATRPGRPQSLLLATTFHFGYAAWWGLVYAALQRWRPAQPHVGGPLLGALIYTLAFSPWGAATQAGAERPVATRSGRETLLHWTAALSFSLTLAYLYARWHPAAHTMAHAHHGLRGVSQHQRPGG